MHTPISWTSGCPHIRRKLTDAIADCPKDVAFVITKFFDEYAAEVHKHMSYEEKTVFPYVRGLLKGIKEPEIQHNDLPKTS